MRATASLEGQDGGSDEEVSRSKCTRHLRGTWSTAPFDVLEAEGLGGATIPKIAAAAGVAPASVYRRFQDRDALLRAAFTSALASGSEASRSITLDAFKDRSFAGVVGAVVGTMIRQYRHAPGLLRAFIRFAEQDRDESFRARALALLSGNMENVVDLVLAFSSEIKHEDPRRALLFAFLSAATIVEEIKVQEISLWHHLLPLNDDALKKELTRMTLAYLRG